MSASTSEDCGLHVYGRAYFDEGEHPPVYMNEDGKKYASVAVLLISSFRARGKPAQHLWPPPEPQIPRNSLLTAKVLTTLRRTHSGNLP